MYPSRLIYPSSSPGCISFSRRLHVLKSGGCEREKKTIPWNIQKPTLGSTEISSFRVALSSCGSTPFTPFIHFFFKVVLFVFNSLISTCSPIWNVLILWHKLRAQFPDLLKQDQCHLTCFHQLLSCCLTNTCPFVHNHLLNYPRIAWILEAGIRGVLIIIKFFQRVADRNPVIYIPFFSITQSVREKWS